jgi:hypothetical protein
MTITHSSLIFTQSQRTKLAGIEELADVTDSVNVDAAGAVMTTDSSTSGMSFVIDEDSMASNSDVKVPTQQSVKSYVDYAISSSGGGPYLTGASGVATELNRSYYIPSGVTSFDLDSDTLSPSIGDWIELLDISGVAGTNNITVSDGGAENFNGVSDTYVLDTNYASVKFVYKGSLGNWAVIPIS